MKLYLVRHATASDIATSDAERELTRDGKEEARVVGSALAKLGVKPGSILSSPLVRARQTAEIAGKELGFPGEVELLDQLIGNTTTPALLKALRPFSSHDEIILVGHMPSLSEHLAGMIGGVSAEALGLGKGSVACVELDELRVGAGQLRWLMRQKQLRQVRP
ncbi:MAG TPA: phosphohistidine phosphatase SixA [Verrucomicrobiae bacterium]|nr:phosphohistidine phosphatase SixA [Verrucomicrobiae bacterium]